ncbi:MAG TPA: PorP/SprF family type IX secretion system membrane protein [Daejeonella sp.]|nr:PorP/SprF family type IX secretion system membrane protein [Daejeonella sp.]
MKTFFNIQVAARRGILWACLFLSAGSMAQLKPLGGQYYINQYLGNPAMAGLNKGLTVSALLRGQFSNALGKPLSQAVTAEYQLKERAGLGLNLYTDQAGVLQQTVLLGTYAYHLPLNETGKLNFGMSLGMMKKNVVLSRVKGDPNDPLLAQYNREILIDGDFGVAYTSPKINLQATLPNLKHLFANETISSTIDRSTFFTAASYIFTTNETATHTTLEPKICYRGVKGMPNVFDAGTEVRFANDQVGLMAMYHSTKNSTWGLRLNFRSNIGVQMLYTTETRDVRYVPGSDFEINLNFKFQK